MNRPPSDEWIVTRLLELPVAERSAFLKRLAADDATLLTRFQRIAASLDERDLTSSSSSASGGGLASALKFALRAETREGEAPGTYIGPYKLLQRLGEGGFGVVWMAEQGEPLRRRVALKIVKTGMDTHEVVARFEAERQALALMDHPNIARVFDAGVTASGRPYFVMELVRGVGITRYCDENRLTTEERLKLFEAVCLGVQHAHQKGVIHRDLKPSNVLVTLHDGVPVPKIIDFGVAKATGGARLTEKTLCTQFHAFVGTPVYTSPEQMEMSGLDVDTRSDIYSLGVLLYELLAGRPPFDPNALAESGLEAMRRTIRDIDPPRPSHRLHTLPDAERTTVARQRSTDVARLATSLHGDLDSIVMRCLEKDRTRRYDTAGALAADVERHLRNEPVVARPPSATYRARKFVRRHRVGVSAIAAVFVTLFAGLTTSSALFLKERTARERAVESERSEQELRRQAEAARAAETIRVSRAARDLGGQMLSQGRTAEGLAWLVHAARTDPGDATLAPRLASILASRRFLLPEGPALSFPAPIVAVHYVSGGSRIAVFAQDGTVGFVDAATGAETRTRLPAGLAAPGVASVGAVTVVLGEDHVVRVLETATARVLREFRFGQKVLQISVTSGDAPDILVILEDRSLVIAETGTGNIRRPPIKISPTDGVAWSEDGQWLSLFQAPYEVGRFWNTRTGTSAALTAPGRAAIGARFSPDGTRLVVMYVTQDYQFAFCVMPIPHDPEQWGAPTLLPEHSVLPSQVQVRFSPDGKLFWIGSQFGMQLFNSATGAKLGPFIDTGILQTTFKPEERKVRFGLSGVAMSFRDALFRQGPGGPQIITPSSLNAPVELTLRDAATGEPVLSAPLSHPAGIVDGRLSEDGSTLLALAADESLLLWNLDTGELRAEPTRLGAWKDIEVALSPDGGELAVGGADGTFRRVRATRRNAQALSMPRVVPMPASFSGSVPGRLVWFRPDRLRTVDLASGAARVGSFEFPEEILSLNRGQTGIAVRQDGRYAVVQTASGSIRAWEIGKNGIERVIPLGESSASRLWSVCFSPRGDLMALVWADNEPIRFWNLATGRAVGVPFVHGDTVLIGEFRRPACFSQDGSRFIVGGASGVVKICEIATGKVLAELVPPSPSVCVSVDASADGTRLATCNRDLGTQLWDAATLQPVGPRLHGVRARFSATGGELLTWAAGTARVWNSRTAAPLSAPMTHPGVGIRDAAFSLDRRRIATAATGRVARIWDGRSGQPISEPLIHKTRVVSCTFDRDARFLLTEEAGSGGPSTYHVWPVPPYVDDRPAPDWLLRLATMWARKRIDETGQCVDAPEVIDGYEELRREVLRLPSVDPFAEWGRWLVDAGTDRTIAPGLAMTPAQAEEIAAELNR